MSFATDSQLKLISPAKDDFRQFATKFNKNFTFLVGGGQHAIYSALLFNPLILSKREIVLQIVYDRESGQSRGFGFVTFTNPRAAAKAIHGLDGGILGGRTIRVNEVKKNSGKSLNRDTSFRDRPDKDRDRRESRDRDRDRNGRDRNLSPNRNRHSPFLRRSARGRSPLISPGHGRSNRNLSPSRRRSHSPRAPAMSPSFNSSSAGRPRANSSPMSPSPQSSNGLHRADDVIHRSTGDRQGSRTGRETHKEIKVREELDRAVQSRQELEDKVTNLTSAVEQAKETVTVLLSKSQKLEESLAGALGSASHRHHQLRKLQKGILQVRDTSERLKAHEKELKVLMAGTMADLELIDMDTGDRQGAIGNGGHYESDKIAEGGGSK